MRNACAVSVGVILALQFAGVGADSRAADVNRGRGLYENHCTVCHTAKVHTRPNRIPLNFEELRQIVTHWAKEEKLNWSQDDIDDVVWYLNKTKYKY